jgi:hypothetical protein
MNGMDEMPPSAAILEGQPVQPRSRSVVSAVLVSAGLIAYLLWTITPGKLAHQIAQLHWQPIVTATVLLIFILYLWDTLCVAWLFRAESAPLHYFETLHARGSSYLLSALNYDLGQGVLVWKMARARGISLLAALGLGLLLAYHDLLVLLGLGWIGASLNSDARAVLWQTFCVCGLLGLLVLAIAAWLLPGCWRVRLLQTRWGSWIGSWTWRRSMMLLFLRSVYYSFFLLYAAVGLAFCLIPISLKTVCSVVPLVLLVDGLPISISGLGTRETTLLYLLDPDQPATLLAFSLIWSSGLMLGRLAIGLACWWITTVRKSSSGFAHEGQEAAT